MRIEHIPLLLGVLIGAIGVALIADAWLPEQMFATTERRRRARAERHRVGEALVGLGTLCLAAALIGRDTWRWGTLAVLIGTILLAAGAVLNRAFLREVLLFRGPARRSEDGEKVHDEVEQSDFRPGSAPRGDLATNDPDRARRTATSREGTPAGDTGSAEAESPSPGRRTPPAP